MQKAEWGCQVSDFAKAREAAVKAAFLKLWGNVSQHDGDPSESDIEFAIDEALLVYKRFGYVLIQEEPSSSMIEVDLSQDCVRVTSFMGGPILVRVDRKIPVLAGHLFTMTCDRLGWHKKEFYAFPLVDGVIGIEVRK
jgi:hypothetical protein